MKCSNHSYGFSLIELAIVLMITSILFATIGIPMYQQHNNVKRQTTQAQLQYIDQHIQYFFLINHRLPCPSDPSSAGHERISNAECSVVNGFVPSVTLGIAGNHNVDLLLVDAWNNPIRYTVSEAENKLWFDPERIQSLSSLHTLTGDLQVCIRHDGCGNSGLWLTKKAPYILLSLGQQSQPLGADQMENSGEQVINSRFNYSLNNDRQFVMRPFDQHSKAPFDDLLHWNSPFPFRAMLLEKNQ